MKYQALRLFLWRWHRRLGLSAAVLLLWLAVSGVMLNHTSALKLASTKLPVSLADSVYPVEYVQVRNLETAWGRIEQLDQALSLNSESLPGCGSNLVGGVVIAQELWIACADRILIVNNEGLLIEALDKYSDLKTPISNIGNCEDSVCIESNLQQFVVDAATASWYPYQGRVSWRQAKTVGQQVPKLVPEIHNWERFILEAHSGRLFGSFGVLVMDLAALAMVLLALSGCYVWWSHHRRRKLASKRSMSADS